MSFVKHFAYITSFNLYLNSLRAISGISLILYMNRPKFRKTKHFPQHSATNKMVE